MPGLLSEMRADLGDHPLRREFVLLERAWSYWSRGDELAYFFDDHDDLHSKVQILANLGLVTDITAGNVARFRISEELAQYLAA